MRLLVTAGGTREPIDAVRFVANTSTGALGSLLAWRAAQAGHQTLLLRAASAVAPPPGPAQLTFGTSAELAALLEEHAPRAEAVFHAAAVSDYVPERVEGKIASTAPELVLRLQRRPKLIDSLRGLCPGGFLVGFKLTAGETPAGQASKAMALLRRARLDLVVANDTSHLEGRRHGALLVDGSGVRDRCADKESIARALLARLPEKERTAT